MKQLSNFDSLVRDLNAVDRSHGGILGKAMQFDDRDNSDVDWLLKRYSAMGETDLSQARKSMTSYPMTRSQARQPLRRPGPTPSQLLERINAAEAATDHTLNQAKTMLKSLNRQARRNINVGAEVSRAREAVWNARESGQIDVKTAAEADLRLRSFALNRLQQLQRR